MKFRVVSKRAVPERGDMNFLLTVQAGNVTREIHVPGYTYETHEPGQDIELAGNFHTEYVENQLARMAAIDDAVRQYRSYPVTKGGMFEERMKGKGGH